MDLIIHIKYESFLWAKHQMQYKELLKALNLTKRIFSGGR